MKNNTIKKPKLSKLAKDKLNPYSRYWKRKCEEAFMSRYRGKPCEICNSTNKTCFHHLLAKSRFNLLRYDPMNGVILCQNHHMFSNDIAPHSMNSNAVERFTEWLKAAHPDKHHWKHESERTYNKLGNKVDYRKLYDRLTLKEVV